MVTAFIGFCVGMLMAGLSSGSEAGVFFGIVVITFSCIYASAYVGRWALANTIESHIMNVEERYRRDRGTFDDRDLARAIVESVGSRLDRAKSESDRRFVLKAMVMAPAVICVTLWILSIVFD